MQWDPGSSQRLVLSVCTVLATAQQGDSTFPWWLLLVAQVPSSWPADPMGPGMTGSWYWAPVRVLWSSARSGHTGLEVSILICRWEIEAGGWCRLMCLLSAPSPLSEASGGGGCPRPLGCV